MTCITLLGLGGRLTPNRSPGRDGRDQTETLDYTYHNLRFLVGSMRGRSRIDSDNLDRQERSVLYHIDGQQLVEGVAKAVERQAAGHALSIDCL